jgi:signal transduction histidine kinase
VVVHLLYHTAGDRSLLGAVGFTVNIDWVTRHYFQEIVNQISRIGQVEDSMNLSVADADGHTVASTRAGGTSGDVLHQRTFPLSFLDAELIGDAPDGRTTPPSWTLSVSSAADPTLAAASRASARTTWLILLSAGVAVMGIVFTVRALKASDELAAMQSEFVASATHELKTPLSFFQLVAETLARGRYTSEEAIRSYGTMLSEQVHLLERLIDNLLAYGSLGHVARRYHFQPLSISELIEAALERFDARLVATGLEVNVDVPAALPPVRGDRVSLLQALDNVIDNAIKYAPQGRALTIRAAADDSRRVRITIRDQGPGIAPDQRDKVFEKFYRGRGVTVGGSGLGLAIARRVVEDHGGSIALAAAEPSGTVVEIALPVQRT